MLVIIYMSDYMQFSNQIAAVLMFSFPQMGSEYLDSSV